MTRFRWGCIGHITLYVVFQKKLRSNVHAKPCHLYLDVNEFQAMLKRKENHVASMLFCCVVLLLL